MRGARAGNRGCIGGYMQLSTGRFRGNVRSKQIESALNEHDAGNMRSTLPLQLCERAPDGVAGDLETTRSATLTSRMH